MKKIRELPLIRHPVTVGVGVMLLLCAILSAAASELILHSVISQERMQTAGIVCAAAASLLGGMITAGRSERRKMVYVVSAAAGFSLVLFAGRLLFFGDGAMNAVGVLLPVLLCAGAGCLLSAAGKSRRGRRKNAGTYARFKHR